MNIHTSDPAIRTKLTGSKSIFLHGADWHESSDGAGALGRLARSVDDRAAIIFDAAVFSPGQSKSDALEIYFAGPQCSASRAQSVAGRCDLVLKLATARVAVIESERGQQGRGALYLKSL